MKYHKIEKDSVANGIGIRCVLWVSGCSVHCKGCQNPQTWSFDYGNIFNVNAIRTICEELKKDEELIELFKSQLTDTCYPDPEYNERLQSEGNDETYPKN